MKKTREEVVVLKPGIDPFNPTQYNKSPENRRRNTSTQNKSSMWINSNPKSAAVPPPLSPLKLPTLWPHVGFGVAVGHARSLIEVFHCLTGILQTCKFSQNDLLKSVPSSLCFEFSVIIRTESWTDTTFKECKTTFKTKAEKLSKIVWWYAPTSINPLRN